MALTVVDTSIWIGALKGARGSPGLEILLNRNEALVHPWVLGELSLGNIGPRREEALRYLALQSPAAVVPDDEVRALVTRHKWHGRGIGWVDAQLAASALSHRAELWTHDVRLRAAAATAGVVLTTFRV